MRLLELENESIFILREAFHYVDCLALLWSMGKDSTVLLHLVKKAFLGRVPIPVVHIDTGYDIPELLAWRDQFVEKQGLRLIVGQNRHALGSGMGPEHGPLKCCGALKTEALLNTVAEHKIKALLVGIRRDEEGSRSKERVVSPRRQSGAWQYKDQPAELWHHFNWHLVADMHLRIHPLLNWTELDIWHYIRAENLELPSQYFAVDGMRYRSLGCLPCTNKFSSDAGSIDQVIDELKTSRITERSGRAQDAASTYAMQELRSHGHM
jgi:sulfate adenylyltransferase subunit 2